MKKILLIVLVAGLASCDNSTKAGSELDSTKKNLDTLVDKVENSKVIDSIKSKGGVILDSVKSKGGKLIDKAEIKINDLKTDSVK